MSDTISRSDAIDAVDSETVSTNPEHFKSSEKFIKFMDDVDIASFGKWQWANGFNTALVATRVQLKKLPSAEPETPSNGSITSINPENTHDRTMGDCISRKDAIKSMANAIWHYPNELYTGLNSYEMCEALAKDGLMRLPSAELRKKGKWIYDNPNTFKCSKCNKYLDIGCGNMKMNFCPNCGADMRGDKDEDR